LKRAFNLLTVKFKIYLYRQEQIISKKKKKLRTREKNSMNGNGKIQDGFLTTETVA
jgi:hypothetical protein